ATRQLASQEAGEDIAAIVGHAPSCAFSLLPSREQYHAAEAGSHSGEPEPAVIVAGFVRIVIEAEVGVGPALPDVPIGKAARAGPGGRVRQPGVLRQPGSLQRIAHRAGTVDADLVLGPAAVRGGQ